MTTIERMAKMCADRERGVWMTNNRIYQIACKEFRQYMLENFLGHMNDMGASEEEVSAAKEYILSLGEEQVH